MGSASSQQKLPLKEIPPNIKTSSRYVLYLMFTYPEGSPDGPTPLWTGSLDEIIDEDLSSNTVLYGWGSSKPFIRKEVDKFVGSVRSREPGVTVRYRIVGPNTHPVIFHKTLHYPRNSNETRKMGNKLSSLMPWRPKSQSHSITFIYGGQINPETFLSTLQAHKDYLKAGSPRTYTREENGSTIITFQQSKPFRTTNEDKLERTVMEMLGLSGNNGTLTKLAISTKTT